MIDDVIHDNVNLDADPELEDMEDTPVDRLAYRFNKFRERQVTKRTKINAKADVKNSKATIIRRASLLLAALKLMEMHHQDKLSKEDYDELKKNAKKAGSSDIVNSIQPGETSSQIKQKLGSLTHSYFKGLI